MSPISVLICIRISLLLISPAPLVSACLRHPEEVALRCEDIKTGGDKYQYPPFDEVCDFEVFDDNQTVKVVGRGSVIPLLFDCLNLTVKCVITNRAEFCKKYVTDGTAPPLLQGRWHVGMAVGIAVAVVVVVVVVIVVVWLRRRTKKQTVTTEDGVLPEGPGTNGIPLGAVPGDVAVADELAQVLIENN